MGLEGVRQAARRDRRLRFTALLHHITPALLEASFYELQHNAAAGVDGVTWREYKGSLHQRVQVLHRKIHTGAYRAQASRRVYIPKADGRKRPLGIPSLKGKIVQQAVVAVLSEICEADFLGFSYGFRCGRGHHDALDAIVVGTNSWKVHWILGRDIRPFFDEIDHGGMLRFMEHRVADRHILALVRKWLKVGVIEDGCRVAVERGTPQGALLAISSIPSPSCTTSSNGSALIRRPYLRSCFLTNGGLRGGCLRTSYASEMTERSYSAGSPGSASRGESGQRR